MTVAAAVAAALWLLVLLIPRPWRIGDRLEADATGAADEYLTAVIPARNEAETIAHTVRSVLAQGDRVDVIVVDDGSTDTTVETVRALGSRVRVITAPARPAGWTGKNWALETGRKHVASRLVLFVDADIVLASGVLRAAIDKQREADHALVSVMAALSMRGAWEKLLLPPFIYFFRLIYPFSRVGNPAARTAAAAGGFMLVKREVLERIGGFEEQRGALIDDVTLARRVKAAGGRLWLGLSRNVASHRRYESLDAVWQMVARTAYVQLRHSPLWLLLAVGLLVLTFVVPLLALVVGPGAARIGGGIALGAMALSFAPLVSYYRLSPAWIATLPVAAALYLAMTVSSAWNWHFGRGPRWKGRDYGAAAN